MNYSKITMWGIVATLNNKVIKDTCKLFTDQAEAIAYGKSLQGTVYLCTVEVIV